MYFSSSDAGLSKEPSSVVMSAIGSELPIGANSPHEPNSYKSANKPENSAEEAERLTGLPTVTFASVYNASPVEHAATGMRSKKVDQQAKDSEPCSRKDEIDWPVNEAAREREKPEEGEEDR